MLEEKFKKVMVSNFIKPVIMMFKDRGKKINRKKKIIDALDCDSFIKKNLSVPNRGSLSVRVLRN